MQRYDQALSENIEKMDNAYILSIGILSLSLKALNCLGLIPVSFLNCALKWAGLLNPSSHAISLIDLSP